MYCKAFFIGFRIQIYVYSKKRKKNPKRNHPHFWEMQERLLFWVTILLKKKELEQMQTIFIWPFLFGFFHMLNAN